MVDRIEDVDGSYQSNSHNGSARLPLEEISIGLGHESRSVEEGFKLRCKIREVSERTEQDTVCHGHLLYAAIDHIAIEGALSILILMALEAGNTPPEGAFEVDHLRFYAILLKPTQHLA